MDCLTPEQRRKAMQANKSKNTKIEISLCKALWKQEIRYRKNFKKLLGAPDIAITKYKVAIFCDGDFCHGRRDISKCSAYWVNKINRNIERDLEITIGLRDAGWTVLRFWESDIKNDISRCVMDIVETIARIKAKASQRSKN